jgi:hypothetical protein
MKQARIAIAILVAFTVFSGTYAQTNSPAPAAATKQQTLQVPSPETLIMLVRSSLLALHHANQTGNYTVLRDLAAPSFQTANSAAQLGQIFANLRNQRVDLAYVALATPELVQGPQIGEDGLLRLVGFFKTPTERVGFQLSFQAVNGYWRPFGVSISPSAENAAAADKATTPPPTKQASDVKKK